jgi:MFS family permease
MNTAALESMETKAVSIDWKQMWSLTALYASIVIGWIAYEQYQPKLLVQFQFTDFAFILAVAQGVILTITPPVAGRLGDRYRFTRGHRFPVISLGISFAAMVFMAVAFTLLSNPGDYFKYVLPVLIICWLVAMSIFTSPALSTIETFIPIEKLPKAMAILTITANLLYSLEPVIVDIIDYIGAPGTFIAGGVLTFLTGFALKKNAMDLFSKNAQQPSRPQASIVFDTQRSSYSYIFVMGVVLGVATSVLFNIFPDILQTKLAELLKENSGKIMVVGILTVSGILSLPFSTLISVYGIRKSFWISCFLTTASILGVLLLSSPLLILLLLAIFAIGFAALSVSSLPLAMEKSNYYEKVFCVGVFFSGVALPDGIIESIQAYAAQF